MRLVRDGRTGCLRSSEKRINVTPLSDDLSEAEFAALRRPLRNSSVLGELATGIEGERQSAIEPKHNDGSRRMAVIASKLGRSDAPRLKAESISIKSKCAFEVANCQRDHIDALLHLFSPFGALNQPKQSSVARLISRSATQLSSCAQSDGAA